jgi:uncharacterized protein
MGEIQADLLSEEAELRETHISWVFLFPDVVLKVKKPVSFGFLDFSTVELRRLACEAEVALNRRLAPDVYLGVIPVTCSEGHHDFDGPGSVVDWAVRMKRLPDAASADVLLEQGRLGVDAIDRLGAAVARFHESARADEETKRCAEPSALARAVRENFEQAHPFIEDYLSRPQIEELETWQTEFIERNAPRLQERVATGRIREGHGDLKLEHVYVMSERLSIIDCIEFNDEFRYLDVCSDLAFLSMDLTAYGRADLAERLVSSYARSSNDYGLFGLIDFYEGFRAYVRGKVAALLARDHGSPLHVRTKAEKLARRYFLLALASARRSMLTPMVVAVGGLIASGKSTVSDRLGLQLGASVVSSDLVRKHLHGVGAHTSLAAASFSGAYDSNSSDRVYERVLENARAVVESGRPVVLDASFRTRRHRAQAQELARSLGVPFRFVECRAGLDTCRRRLEERGARPHQSDARADLLDTFARSWERIDEVPAAEHLVVQTDGTSSESWQALRDQLPVWPEHR